MFFPMNVSKIKNSLRRNCLIEVASYLVHNNLLSQVMNFSGAGGFGTTVDELYAHGVKIAEQYLSNTSDGIHGENILELGCGFSLATACYLVKEARAKHVFAYDWFECRHKNDRMLLKKYGFTECLDKITYITGDYNKLTINVAPKSIDRVFSNAVLEHVSDLELFFTVIRELLVPAGRMHHRVDLRCHNRFRSQGELYFHTFSPLLWAAMGSKVGHPNRWLLKDYIDLFERHGFSAEIDIISVFPAEVLSNAQSYLNNRKLSDYQTSVFDAVLSLSRDQEALNNKSFQE